MTLASQRFKIYCIHLCPYIYTSVAQTDPITMFPNVMLRYADTLSALMNIHLTRHAELLERLQKQGRLTSFIFHVIAATCRPNLKEHIHY